MVGTLRGVEVREHKGVRTAVAQVGAETAEDAEAKARLYLEGRGLALGTATLTGGERLKIGVAGWRRWTVRFPVLGE